MAPEQLEVYVTNYPATTAKWQVSNEGGSRPSWSAAGKLLPSGLGWCAEACPWVA